MFDDLIPKKEEKEKKNVSYVFSDVAINKIKEYKKDRNLAIVCPKCNNMTLKHVSGDIVKGVPSQRIWEINSFQCKDCYTVFLTRWESK